LRMMVEQGGEEQQRQQHEHAGEYRGQSGQRAGVEVDRRTREGTGYRVGLAEGSDKVASPWPISS